MYLSNQLVYNGCLKCGSDSVGSKVIYLPNKEKISQVCFYSNNNINFSLYFLATEQAQCEPL